MQPSLDKIRIEVGWGGRKKEIQGVVDVMINPKYKQTEGETDVAMIKTKEDIFEVDDNGATDPPSVAPICLPPKMGYNGANENKEEGILEPFEDLDCKNTEDTNSFPLPSVTSFNSNDRGKVNLFCHPHKFLGQDVNVVGRNSFITGFGPSAREDFKEKARYQCTTNSFGPRNGIFQKCQSKCHKNLESKVEVMMNDNQVKMIDEGNPSMADELCSNFIKEHMKDADEKVKELKNKEVFNNEGFRLDQNSNFGWVHIIDNQTGAGDKELYCYPHKHAVYDEYMSNWDKPYKYGWCKTCDDGASSCNPKPNEDWGWCQPQCDADPEVPFEVSNLHEAAVDSFVYDGCSPGVNTETEFCTGTPIVKSYGQKWIFKSNGTYQFERHEMRQYLQQADTDPHFGPLKPKFHSVIDSCYGDAGGSVWKFWNFKGDGVERVAKLAVLTGVVSRFEDNCGMFIPVNRGAIPNFQFTIHTRYE